MSEKQSSKKRGIGRWIKIGVVATLSLIVGVTAAVFVLVRTEPAHWKAHQKFLETTSPEQIEQMASGVQDKLMSLTQLVDGAGAKAVGSATADAAGQPGLEGAVAVAKKIDWSTGPMIKTLQLGSHEMNAWITEKFRDWMAYRDFEMPEEIADPMVAIDDGRLRMSFAFQTDSFEQVFTAGFDVVFRKDEKAELRLKNVMAGNLSLLSDGIGSYIRKKAPDSDQVRQVADWLDKLDKVVFKPSMKLGKDHKALVLGYAVNEKGVALKVRVAKREGYGRKPAQIAAAATDAGE